MPPAARASLILASESYSGSSAEFARALICTTSLFDRQRRAEPVREERFMESRHRGQHFVFSGFHLWVLSNELVGCSSREGLQVLSLDQRMATFARCPIINTLTADASHDVGDKAAGWIPPGDSGFRAEITKVRHRGPPSSQAATGWRWLGVELSKRSVSIAFDFFSLGRRVLLRRSWLPRPRRCILCSPRRPEKPHHTRNDLDGHLFAILRVVGPDLQSSFEKHGIATAKKLDRKR